MCAVKSVSFPQEELRYHFRTNRMKTSKKARTVGAKPKPSPGGSKVRQSILDAYIARLQKTGQAHVSVHSLCLDLKISEKEFYGEFPSLSSVEKAFWRQWIDRIISAVTGGKEWDAFSAKEQYLAFLFAFAGEALERRSLLEQRFSKLTLLCSPKALEGLKDSFRDFAGGIIAHGMETGEIAHRGPLGNAYPEVLYIHWRLVLEYFLKDESTGFQRTDAFIEKTVELAFDLLRTQAIDSAADLVRFLLPQIANLGKR
jgi:hypothetical protein